MNITETENPIPRENKEEALNFVLKECFKSGFGALGKSDIDLILFTAILKYADHDSSSDHFLSKHLQITQQRVRNLKEKASVKYLVLSREQAVERFVEKTAYAKLEGTYIDVPVNDIAVKNEIEAMLDEKNLLLHSQLNPKVFRLRIDDFLELAIQIELATNSKADHQAVEKRILKMLKKIAKEQKSLETRMAENGLKLADLTLGTVKEALVKGGVTFGVDLLASLVPAGAFLAEPTKKLLEAIQQKA